MKLFKKTFMFLAIAIASVGCKKGGDNGLACENNETTKVTFKNTSAASLRIEMAKTFNAQFMPIDAVFTFDLAPGASSIKEFRYGKYFIQWKNNCVTSCSQRAFYVKDFLVCQEYEETQ